MKKGGFQTVFHFHWKLNVYTLATWLQISTWPSLESRNIRKEKNGRTREKHYLGNIIARFTWDHYVGLLILCTGYILLHFKQEFQILPPGYNLWSEPVGLSGWCPGNVAPSWLRLWWTLPQRGCSACRWSRGCSDLEDHFSTNRFLFENETNWLTQMHTNIMKLFVIFSSSCVSHGSWCNSNQKKKKWQMQFHISKLSVEQQDKKYRKKNENVKTGAVDVSSATLNVP